jgi:hypothetical protein
MYFLLHMYANTYMYIYIYIYLSVFYVHARIFVHGWTPRSLTNLSQSLFLQFGCRMDFGQILTNPIAPDLLMHFFRNLGAERILAKS